MEAYNFIVLKILKKTPLKIRRDKPDFTMDPRAHVESKRSSKPSYIYHPLVLNTNVIFGELTLGNLRLLCLNTRSLSLKRQIDFINQELVRKWVCYNQ